MIINISYLPKVLSLQDSWALLSVSPIKSMKINLKLIYNNINQRSK